MTRQRRTPLTGLLREFGLQMHVQLDVLARAPSASAFDALAQVFNVVQIAIRDDARHSQAAAVINDAACTLIATESRICTGTIPAAHELASIRSGVNAIDGLLGRLTVEGMYGAMRELQTMRNAQWQPTTTRSSPSQLSGCET